MSGLVFSHSSVSAKWGLGMHRDDPNPNHPENQALSSSESVLTTLPSPMGMGSVGERSELSTLSNLLADFLHDH